MNGAKGFLGFTAGMWGFFTITMLGLGTLDLILPGGLSTGETLKRMALCIGTAALGAIAFYAARRLRPGNRLAWFAGLGVHLVTIAVLLAGAAWAITAPRREGLLAVSGVVVGGLSIPSLVGLVLLLSPKIWRAKSTPTSR